MISILTLLISQTEIVNLQSLLSARKTAREIAEALFRRTVKGPSFSRK